MLVASAVIFCPATSVAQVTDPRDAAKVFVEATASGNVDALANLYAPNAIMLLPKLPVINGRDAIRKVFARNAALGANSIKFTDIRTDRGADYAVVMWAWVSEIKPNNGAPVRMSGRSLVYFKRSQSGWLISADMFQAAPN